MCLTAVTNLFGFYRDIPATVGGGLAPNAKDNMIEVEVNEKEICTLTLDQLGDLSDMTQLNCDGQIPHRFNTDSIKLWIAQKGEDATCPICRKKINEVTQQRFYSVEKVIRLKLGEFSKEAETVERVEGESKRAKSDEVPKASNTNRVESQEKEKNEQPKTVKKTYKRFVPVSAGTPEQKVLSPTVAKIVNSIPFKIAYIPFNCLHWVTYGVSNGLSYVAQAIFVVAGVILSCIGWGIRALTFAALSPLTGVTYLTVLAAGGDANRVVEFAWNGTIVPAIAVGAVPVFIGVPLYLTAVAMAISQPAHNPVSLFNRDLVNSAPFGPAAAALAEHAANDADADAVGNVVNAMMG